MRIYLIRHGESVDDVEDCYGGIADFELTDRGREQARVVGKGLMDCDIQAIYSSPLARARESAELIAGVLTGNIPVFVVDELQERNTYGVLSGVNKDKAKQIFGSVLARLTEKPGYSRETPIGGEDYDAFVLRVRRAFDYVVRDAQAAGRNRIAIVTHGKFSHALFQNVLEWKGEVDLKLSAVNVIEYEPAVVNLVRE
jgi:broad specificity phosphatase PhoE